MWPTLFSAYAKHAGSQHHTAFNSQDADATGQKDGIPPPAPITEKPLKMHGRDISTAIKSRAAKLHRQSPLKQRRYLSVCQSLANGGCLNE
jgi:hypothetical protein